ncbi:MAG TPA: type III pantothenate kinase [Usitatibacter sp.]|nr:type III pantothenate kinase [Usitatibacter sp.]
MNDPEAVVLALDAGNTRIKWGVHDGVSWSVRGAVATGEAARLYESLRPALPVEAAIACNVAGAAVRSQLEEACRQAGIALRMIGSVREQLGVKNAYRDPAQLGADRWAALIAAHHGHRGDKLVVNVGTALTIDALTATGQFLGGLIVPGPALMRRSLDQGTAALREAPGAVLDFPDATAEAIASGAVHACVGAISRMGAAMAARGTPPGRIILSGGAAGEIEKWLPYPATFQENLVLDGLLAIARND